MNKSRMAIMLGALWAGAAVAGSADPAHGQGSGTGYKAIQSLQAQAQAALTAGDARSATVLALRLLRENTDRTSWNYGNVVYDGNQILGLAALRRGDVTAAERYLIAAGKTPGSPQLDSFGPEMTLAQALEKRGRTRAVLTFLDSVALFWATPKPGTDARFLPLYEQHAATIKRWKAEIHDGKQASLDRFDFPKPSAGAPLTLLADGTAAPDFTVQDKDGRPVKLSDYKGRSVVLDFWATWCGPCQSSLPHTNAVANEFKDRNVIVLAVNVWDTKAAFDAWLPAHPEYGAISFAIDPTRQQGQDIATRLYHVSGIPTQYIVGPDGKIVKSIVGYGGPTEELASALKSAAGS